MRKRASADWTYDGDYVSTVASETEPGKTYDIRRRNGTLVCDCASYRFSRTPKSCKHLEAFAPVAGAVMNVPTRKPVSVTSSARGETFTITRRGISFSEDLR